MYILKGTRPIKMYRFHREAWLVNVGLSTEY